MMFRKMIMKNCSKSTVLDAIKALDNPSGSSLQAIVKLLKATVYKETDKRRLSRLVLIQLKRAANRGELVQVNRLFKLPNRVVKKRNAIGKGKFKKLNVLKAKAQSVPTKQVMIGEDSQNAGDGAQAMKFPATEETYLHSKLIEKKQ